MFDVLTPLDRLHRINFPIADADEFEAGEWGEVSPANGGTMAKVVGNATAMCYAVFQGTENRWDRLATQKATVVYGVYIADTDQYDSTATYDIDTPLTVTDGRLVPAAPGENVYAWVIIPPSANTEAPDHLRFTTERLGTA